MIRNTNNPVLIVQGGQWGSEAKGAVAAHLCLVRQIDWAVRTGAINAGHTVVYNGKPYAMQQIPTGWVNPNTKLVIGAGAYIHTPTLFREIAMINEAMPGRDVRDRLFIDYRCGIHDEVAEEESKKANRHHSMGATGKGCSEAIVAKIRNRNSGYKLFREVYVAESDAGPLKFKDTVLVLNTAIGVGDRVLIEGTQGTHLDLHIGPYPFTTSRMTSAANWIAEAGLPPSIDYEVVLVCRTFPIRVAGNSGPMNGEIEWTDLARDVNGKLSHIGKQPLVSEQAMREFEINLVIAANNAGVGTKYPLPANTTFSSMPNIWLSTWTPEQRDKFRVAASELHRDALNLCSPETVTELRKLFEMTTVTKKLRRIAAIDYDDLRYAVAINNPAWIALTFMDYVEPELHNLMGPEVATQVSREAQKRASDFVLQVERETNTPVKLISVGPSPGNLFSPLKLYPGQSEV